MFVTYIEHKGFHVTRAAATVHTPNGGRSPEGSHMSLYVNIEGTLYITDVGFGDLPTSIIEIGSKTQFIPTYDKMEFTVLFGLMTINMPYRSLDKING